MISATDAVRQALIEQGYDLLTIRGRGDGAQEADCPAHCGAGMTFDERWQEPLTIREGDDGRVVIRCGRGCTGEAICRALGLPATILSTTGKVHGESWDSFWCRIHSDEMAPGSAPNDEAPEAVPTDGAPVLVRLSDVKPEQVSWLWPNRFALGKLTLIAGDPGLGKSFLTLDMAARVSRGMAWPDAPSVATTPGGVVLLSAEDGIADTIRPRLDAAGADADRIVALQAVQSLDDNLCESHRAFDLSRDMPALDAAIKSLDGCRLVVIDPVTAYLGGVDSHKNADMRGLLATLAAMAERHHVAIVAVTHLNKSGGGPAIYRTTGSLAFTAAARAAWVVSKDKGDPCRRLLLPIKNNLAADEGGLAYRIEQRGGSGCPVVAWEPNPVSMSADDALATDQGLGGGRTARDEAADWLRDLLASGPRLASEVEQAASDAGYSVATLRRAKDAVGAESRKAAFGGQWEWALAESAQDAQPPKMLTEDAHTQPGEHLREKPVENAECSSKMLNRGGVSTLGEHLGGIGCHGSTVSS